ncbi:MAG: adenylate/guanylate cyclase domain-containing protein [Xanthobacteraceae bacterium]|jgi:adenylate cyclase
MDAKVFVPPPRLSVDSFDGPLGRSIIDTHIWAVHQGLRGAGAYALFDGYCQRLVIHGVPLWRAQAGMQTLHPHWGAYSYLWRRDLNAIQPEQHARSDMGNPQWLRSPMYDLIRRANAGENNPSMRRHLDAGPDQRDFAALDEFFGQGATDYFAQLFSFGESGDPSQGTGAIYSFTTDRAGGFDDNDMALLQSTLPALSLAMKAHASHEIGSALLRTYLGQETGRRVHAGAIERGSVETVHAVLWFADIRGFTAMSDSSPGAVVIDLLNSVFEALAAALRSRSGEILKFLGDGMLATLAFDERDRATACRAALDAAAEAISAIAALNATRTAAGLPAVTVDLALHVGDLLYGNVGAADRLDFTVIGPAVNEVARIEAWCEPLQHAVLASAEFAAALQDTDNRLISLGCYELRGVREPKEIFGLAPGAVR